MNFDQYHLKQCLVVKPPLIPPNCQIVSRPQSKNLTTVDFRNGLKSHAEALQPKIQRVEVFGNILCYCATTKNKMLSFYKHVFVGNYDIRLKAHSVFFMAYEFKVYSHTLLSSIDRFTIFRGQTS